MNAKGKSGKIESVVIPNESDVSVRYLRADERPRGPGGHWFHYSATKDGLIAYGQTALEAIKSLQAVLAVEDPYEAKREQPIEIVA